MPQFPKLKILGIAGSPRKDGNTDLLLEQVLAGVSNEQNEIKKVVLRELRINFCRHCGGCLKTGTCVQQDDMKWLHRDLREADYIILASPIFFMALAAQTKAMIDRCQALWVMKHILKVPVSIPPGKERKGIFISVGGTKFDNLFEPSRATLKAWFSTLEVKSHGELTFRSIDEKGAISKHPTALQDAYNLGKRLTLKHPEAISPGNDI
jgi:multimeric flavodoxin WrbA